jgi:hypothetical protein
VYYGIVVGYMCIGAVSLIKDGGKLHELFNINMKDSKTRQA